MNGRKLDWKRIVIKRNLSLNKLRRLVIFINNRNIYSGIVLK